MARCTLPEKEKMTNIHIISESRRRLPCFSKVLFQTMFSSKLKESITAEDRDKMDKDSKEDIYNLTADLAVGKVGKKNKR